MENNVTNDLPYLESLRRKWAISLGLKLFFCVLSLQVFLGSPSLDLVFIFIGFVCPLIVMCWYLCYANRQVKECPSIATIAGNSAYFLGFLFTIASIVVAMLDIAFTNMHDEAMSYIASRFALAMVTTLLGMGYRTWLIGFTHKKAQEGFVSGKVGGGARDSAQDSVQVIVRALFDDDSRFKSLASTMEQAINEYARVVTNACASTEQIQGNLQILVENTGKRLNESVQKIIEDAAKVTHDSALEANQKFMTEYLESQKTLSLSVAESTKQLQEQLKNINEDFQNWNEETKGIHTSVRTKSMAMEKSLGKLTDSITNLGGSIDSTQKNVQDELALIEKNIERIQAFSERLNNAVELNANLEKKLTEWMTSAEKQTDVQLKIQQGLKQTTSSLQSLPQVTAGLEEAVARFKNSVDYLNNNLTEIQQRITIISEKTQALATTRKGPWWRLFRK